MTFWLAGAIFTYTWCYRRGPMPTHLDTICLAFFCAFLWPMVLAMELADA